MSKKVAILQSSYIPWKGHFDLIRCVDEFILLDDVQFTRRDWRNRNKIKTPQGPKWLTIPVHSKGKYHQKIRETQISDPDWAKRHWESIRRHYRRARCFEVYREQFEALYLGCGDSNLSLINARFLRGICSMLGIQTNITWSHDYAPIEGKTARLSDLCRQAGASEYVATERGKDYIEEELFEAVNVALCYASFEGYPEYGQLYPPFDHYVSVIDLLFNEGTDAISYMKNLLE